MTVPAAAEAPVRGLAIAQFANLPVTLQQIECEKARRVSTAEQQIFELWSATSIEGANFAVNDRSHIRQQIGDGFCQCRERRDVRCEIATEHRHARRLRVP